MIQKYFAFFLVMLVCQSLSGQEVGFAEDWDRFLVKEEAIKSRQAAVFFMQRSTDVAAVDELLETGWSVVRKLDEHHVILQKPNGLMTVPPGLTPVNDLWKLSPNLIPDRGQTLGEDLIIKTQNVGYTSAFLRALGFNARLVYEGMIMAKGLNAESLKKLMARAEVIYIGAESQKAIFDSRVLDMNLNPNRVNQVHHEFPALRGQGLVLSVKESGYDKEDIDLVSRNRESELSADLTSGHATEMATIAAGAGNSSLNGRGVAGAVTLTSSFLDALFPDQDQDYRSLNVSVQNHSYGTTEVENFYGASAEAYDLSANANPTLLHVFSVGNLGESAPVSGPYAGLEGIANLSGNFKESKNTLSVGSVDTVGRKVDFVSNGPAHDGRIKPELVAYSVFGSSNSAALVSGVSLLLQQAYQEQEGTLPTAALLKALLINGARDVGTAGPDYFTGFGNLDAYRSLESLNAGHYALGTVANGAEQELSINLPAGVKTLKVTLVWNDPAAQANANQALVNDLDLVLEDAQSNTWLPWVLDPAADRLTATATRGEDRLNNVEQVTIANPPAGAIKMMISGSTVPQGPQSYALVWEWEEADRFEWTFPTGSDNMPYNGETTGYFRWNSSMSTTTGRLEYSVDGGNNWLLIDANVSLAEGQYRWKSPDLKTAALARMVVEGQPFTTEAFTISRPERIAVGFSCADSVRIQWNSIEDAMSYELLSLDGAWMSEVAAITDTAFTFRKSDFESRFFAVQPVLEGGVRPIRSATFDYDFQGVGCYLISLASELSPEEGVYLNLALGTSAGIQNIEFQRQSTNEAFETFSTMSSAEIGRTVRLLDSTPLQGLNNYRVRLLFQNGETLISEVTSVYFLTTRPFLVFPNPLPRGEFLNVFSRQFADQQQVTLTLFNHSGRRVFDLALNSDRFAFDLSRLPAGIYTYRITTEGLSDTGRLILNQ